MNKKFVTLLALLALMLTVEAGAESFTELYKKAKAGDVVAQFDLGFSYYKKQDFKNAVKWWKKAADQGDESAQFNLGLAYYKG